MEAELTERLGNCPRLHLALTEHFEINKRDGEDSPEAKAALEHLKKMMKNVRGPDDHDNVCQPAYTSNDPRSAESQAERQQLHLDLMVGGLYTKLTWNMTKEIWGDESHVYNETTATSVLHAGDVLKRMNPRDPMEEMLIAQSLWTHARIAYLTNLSIGEMSFDGLPALQEVIDRANNTYRRQMLALAEYRRPVKGGDTYNKIQQANIANQQVVQNELEATHNTIAEAAQPKEKPTNELGFNHDTVTTKVDVSTPVQAKQEGGSSAAGRG